MMLGCSIVAVIAPLLLGAFACLLFTGGKNTERQSAWISGLSIAVAMAVLLAVGPHAPYAFEAPFIITDGLTVVVTAFLLLLTLGVVLLGSGTLQKQGIDMPAEYHALILLSTIGALVFISAGHFLVLFLGLEILSLALYALCAASIQRPRSAEGAIKYFILGATSSAILMFGVALLFGVTGSLSIVEIRQALESTTSQTAMFGIAFIIIGIAFKMALVPFHTWSPDAYLGAPLSVAAYMSTVVKTAAVIVAVRVIWFGFEHAIAFWSNAVVGMAVASIVVGNLLSLRQTRFRRLMAYSGISHAGFMTIGLLARLGEGWSAGAVLFYALTYPLLTLGFFAVLHTLMQEENAADDTFESVRGLFFRSPWLASVATFFLFGLAGLPPALIGFLSKWYVLQVAWSAEYPWVVAVGVVFSVVGAAYYLKPVTLMFQRKLEDEKKTKSDEELLDTNFVVSQQRIVAAFLLLLTLWISIFPSGLSVASDELMQEINEHVTVSQTAAGAPNQGSLIIPETENNENP